MKGTGKLRRVVLAYGLFVLVELSIWIVVLLYAFEISGAGLASVVSVSQLVPAALLAPLFAGMTDRMPRGRALVATHLAVTLTVALTLVMLLLQAPFLLVVLASGAATIALATVRPAHYAALPQLATHPQELVRANAWCSGVENLMVFAGPALAGVAMAVSGPALAFGCATALAALAALLSTGLGLGAATGGADGDGDGAAEPFWREATEGLRALRHNPGALAVLLLMTLEFVLSGALEVLGIAYATQSLGLDETAAGTMVGGLGIGGLLGAVAAPFLGRRRALAPLVVAGGMTLGVAFAVVGATGSLASGLAALAVAGVGGTVVLVVGRTLLQRTTDDVVLARVFAVQESASLVGLAVGAALAPVLVHLVGPGDAFVPLGLLVAVLALGVTRTVRRLDAAADLRTDELDLLRRVPFLAVLPPYELERLARHAAWQEVAAGTEVVRQGDLGEEFYVLADGELAVTVDGVPRAEPLLPGEGFGEIALLHAVPRTASVAARTDARLLVIRAEDFLAAVTGSPDGHRIAAEVARAHLARSA